MFSVKVKGGTIKVFRKSYDHKSRSYFDELYETYKIGDAVTFGEYYGSFRGGKREIEVAPLGANGIVTGVRNIAYKGHFDYEEGPEYFMEQCIMVTVHASLNQLAVPLTGCRHDDRPFKPWHTRAGHLKCVMKEEYEKYPHYFPRDKQGRFV